MKTCAKTILVADDDRDVAHLLTMRLQQLGLSVMRSPDATHALLGIQRFRPDLVILDVMMPGGSGLAVAEMLATNPDMRMIPVIIHTVSHDEITRLRCELLGHHYVAKSPE